MNLDPLLNNKINSIIELYSSGQISDALESIEVLIRQNPKESILHNISGVCLKASGQLEMAVQSFKSAINLKSNFADAHFNLALTHQELDNMDDAIFFANVWNSFIYCKYSGCKSFNVST